MLGVGVRLGAGAADQHRGLPRRARLASAAVDSVWLLGFAAAFGQMVGKVVWYYLGANSLHWGWVAQGIETPKAQARLETVADPHPRAAGARPARLVFASAFSGFPPFAIVAVLAGQLRMSLPSFFVLGLVGRWLRFAGGARRRRLAQRPADLTRRDRLRPPSSAWMRVLESALCSPPTP